MATATFPNAVALFQQGQWLQAEAALRTFLQRNPRHTDALYLRGLIAIETRQPARAVDWLGKAVRLNPSMAAAHGAMGHAQNDLGRPMEALASYNRALSLNPNFIEILISQGFTLNTLGRAEDALDSLRRALVLNPNVAEAHDNIGHVLNGLKRHADALPACDQAIRLNPRLVPAHVNRGVALMGLMRMADAVEAFGSALSRGGDVAEAALNRSIALTELDRYPEAITDARKALSLRPHDAQAHIALAQALSGLDHNAEALTHCEQALQIAPRNLGAYAIQAQILLVSDQTEAALAVFARGLAANPGSALLHYERSFALLRLGHFAAGWTDHEYRWGAETFDGKPPAAFPWWHGEDTAGKRILIFTEQGLGDTIQFARFLPLLVERGVIVTFLVDKHLARLLISVTAGLEVIHELPEDRVFDAQCGLLSLPLHLGTIAANVPYLRAEPDLVRTWSARLPRRGLLIGVAWQGNPKHKNDLRRSFPLSALAPLADIPGVQLISLQRGYGEAQIQQYARIETLGDAFYTDSNAFLDTAAVMRCCDLVIACDSAVAHLAGALNVPCWVGLPHTSDWRWMLGRTDSPWYPNMRLFRQSQRGDWAGVFAAMATALRDGAIIVPHPNSTT